MPRSPLIKEETFFLQKAKTRKNENSPAVAAISPEKAEMTAARLQFADEN